MKSILPYYILFTLLLTFGCRKESNSGSNSHCGHTFSSGTVKVGANIGQSPLVKVFRNGTVAVLLDTDTLKFYDSNLNYKGYLFIPGVYDIMPLEDNTFVSLQTETTISSSDTTSRIDGYGFVGGDLYCQDIYVFNEWDIYQKVQEITTFVKRYNLKGDLLSVHALDGFAGSVVESEGNLYAASLDQDTFKVELSFTNGIYNDTVVYGGDHILHLYKLGMDGEIHLHKKIFGIKKTHIFYPHRYPETEIVGGSLWTELERTFIQYDKNLNVIHQFPNPLDSCTEDVMKISGNARELVVRSEITHLSIPAENVIYTIDGTGIPVKLPPQWRNYTILGSSASDILLGGGSRIVNVDRSGNVLWQTGQSYELEVRTFQASCNGQIFGIATSFNHNYLMKISNDGVVPEIRSEAQ